MLTSSGISTHSKSRSLSCYIQALLSNGQDNMTHYKSSNARTFQTLDPASCLQEAYSFAKDMLSAQKIASGNYSVIFSPNELPEFMESFSIALSGRAAKEGQNPWKDSIGKQVASTQLTLRDIPHYPQAYHFSLYDSEGNVHRDISLIEQGILKTFYHNSATARFFKIPNNASASRSIKGRLGIGGTTQVISAGRDSDSSLKSGTYIEVHAMQGLHSGRDAISGDFSFGAKGYLWQNGTCTPFKDVTIAGNYYKLLQQIEGIGEKIYHDDGRSFFSPIIRWHGMLTSR
jgi:PmbA protein